MRILVTGGNGFIGAHCVDAFSRAGGHRVRVFDRSGRRFGALPPDVEFTKGDISDNAELRRALAGVEVVLHLAWTGVHETSTRDPAADVTANLVPTLELIDAAVALGVRRVVFLSSGGTVYGAVLPPVAEEHPTDPISAYGITKLAVEKYLYLYHAQLGLDYVVLRPSVPYGPGQDPHRRQGVVSVFLHRLAQRQPLEVWGDGSAIRDYFYIDDLAAAVVAAATGRIDGPRVFNLGGGRGYSISQLLAALEEVTGRAPQVEYRQSRRIDPPTVILDTTRAAQHLGWRPMIDLHTGIARTWNWILSDKKDL